MAEGDGTREEARALRIEGRVQGVGFRWWTRETARSLGVRGWVRNLPDGAVEAHLSGAPEAVERMRSRLREGPRGAGVSEVVDQGEARELPARGFEIRR